MQHSPDPAHRTMYGSVTWYGVLVSYAMLAAVPLLLWASSDPLAAGAVATAAAFLIVGTRRARRLAQCVRTCQSLAFDLPGPVRVTVAWRSACDVN